MDLLVVYAMPCALAALSLFTRSRWWPGLVAADHPLKFLEARYVSALPTFALSAACFAAAALAASLSDRWWLGSLVACYVLLGCAGLAMFLALRRLLRPV